jgi:hypothetical protein
MAGGVETYEALRNARPDGRTVPVEDVTIERDVFTLRFKGGTFHLLAPVDGVTLGAVYLGKGELRLEPATEAERRAISFRAEKSVKALEDTFDRAVLLFTDGTAEEILAGSAPQEGSPAPAAVDAYEKYLRWQRKSLKENVHLSMVREILNDEGLEGGVFAAALHGKRFEKALVRIDPLGVLDAEESSFVVDGKYGFEYWYSSHTRREIDDGTAVGCRKKLVVDALHYDVATEMSGTDMTGEVTVRLKTVAPSVAVLPFGLLPTLRIEEAGRIAADGTAAPLGFVQEDKNEDADPALFLDPPLRAGEEATVRIRYGGKGVLIADGDGVYRVEARTNWYPNLGVLSDYATYDLTYRVPPENQVVSVGDHAGTSEESGRVVSRWKSDRPIAVAGFNYGKFRTIERNEPNSGMTIRVYTNPGTPDVISEINEILRSSATVSVRDATAIAGSEGGWAGPVSGGATSVTVSTDLLADNAMADTVNSVQVFSRFFGPIPDKTISISQQSQWAFGQAWPSLVFIPYLAALDGTARNSLGITGAAAFIDQVTIHEVAHQWWGQMVGWESYRDQWLSEGFAEFSTGLVIELSRGPQAADEFWRRQRIQVLGKARGEELAPVYAGPVTLGHRLWTERATDAYDCVVYNKGAFILHMLRVMMRDPESPEPDKAFFDMMKDFAATYAGRNASTEDFKAMVEKHMVPSLNAYGDGKADWFFDQWVYGTEVPTYRVDMAIDKAGKGKYRLHGTISQDNVSDDFIAMVPAYIDFGKGQYGMFGRAPFKGKKSQAIDITLELPKKPKGIVVNAHYENLAWDPAKKK